MMDSDVAFRGSKVRVTSTCTVLTNGREKEGKSERKARSTYQWKVQDKITTDSEQPNINNKVMKNKAPAILISLPRYNGFENVFWRWWFVQYFQR
jgi:hypothetical protein